MEHWYIPLSEEDRVIERLLDRVGVPEEELSAKEGVLIPVLEGALESSLAPARAAVIAKSTELMI